MRREEKKVEKKDEEEQLEKIGFEAEGDERRRREIDKGVGSREGGRKGGGGRENGENRVRRRGRR